VNRIKGASASLLSIVNDILDFSTLEAGRVVIDPEPVDAVWLAQDALAMFGPRAEQKGLGLAFEAAPDIPGHVQTDPNRLRQILMNLIGNAVKFTERGEVLVRLSYDQTAGALAVRVEDSGPGLSERQRQRLFQRFSQVDGSSTRHHGGTGLGLAISKGLIEALGGEIGVESQPARGSVFFFRIVAPPADAPAMQDPDAEACLDLRGVRVLVVDDNPTDREIVRAILESVDAGVTDAVDGSEAVELAVAEPFDVIMMDINMPVLDGVGALKRIRAGPGPNQKTPIFAFTAHLPDTISREPGGFDGVISKPIVPRDMIRTLIEATDWRASEQNGEPPRAVGF
jgi:CheY-like chemotaxis protein